MAWLPLVSSGLTETSSTSSRASSSSVRRAISRRGCRPRSRDIRATRPDLLFDDDNELAAATLLVLFRRRLDGQGSERCREVRGPRSPQRRDGFLRHDALTPARKAFLHCTQPTATVTRPFRPQSALTRRNGPLPGVCGTRWASWSRPGRSYPLLTLAPRSAGSEPCRSDLQLQHRSSGVRLVGPSVPFPGGRLDPLGSAEEDLRWRPSDLAVPTDSEVISVSSSPRGSVARTQSHFRRCRSQSPRWDRS